MCEDFTWCSFIISIVTGLISSFMAFLITLVIFSRSCLKISSLIARGVNKSFYEEDGEVAWKFKMVNKSPFVKLSDIDTKLIGIQYVKNDDGTYTEHRKNIPCIAGVRILGRYVPTWLVRLRRKKNPKYTINYSYRPVTFVDLNNSSYDEMELSILYTDSISGWRHFTSKRFSKVIIDGEFSNDGRLNRIISQKIPQAAWDNHYDRMSKEKNSDKNENMANHKGRSLFNWNVNLSNSVVIGKDK